MKFILLFISMSINNIGCSLTAGYKINYSCALSESGIKELFLMKHSYFSQDGCKFNSDDLITEIYTGAHLWYKFDMIYETAEYIEKDAIDAKSGMRFWDSTLTVLFHKNRANLRKQMLQMMNENRLVGIFHTNDDRYFLVGKERGLDISAEVKVEKSYAGFNGQVLQLKGLEKMPAYEIASSAVTYSQTVITRGPILATNEPAQGL